MTYDRSNLPRPTVMGRLCLWSPPRAPPTFATYEAWNSQLRPFYYLLYSKVVFASGPRHAYPQHLPHVEHGTFLVKNAIYKKSSLPVVPARNTPNICHIRGTEQSQKRLQNTKSRPHHAHPQHLPHMRHGTVLVRLQYTKCCLYLWTPPRTPPTFTTYEAWNSQLQTF